MGRKENPPLALNFDKYGKETKAVVVYRCLVKAAPRDLSIEEIAKATHVSRDTVSKYVYALAMQEEIVMTRQVGRAKFYTVKT